METRTGEVRYADALHRRGITPTLRLDACDVLVSPVWTRSTEGLTNRVTVIYGPEPEDGGEQPSLTVANAESIAVRGRYDTSLSTELARLADAQAKATLLLTRNSYPVWIMSALPVDVAGLTEADTLALLSLDMHELVELTGLPVVGTTPGTASLWVEGWSERLAYGAHELTLSVSGYCRTSPPPRWDDYDPAATWDTAPGTWDQAVCGGPQPTHGRWSDVPASTRWNMVPTGTTWDTWT